MNQKMLKEECKLKCESEGGASDSEEMQDEKEEEEKEEKKICHPDPDVVHLFARNNQKFGFDAAHPLPCGAAMSHEEMVMRNGDEKKKRRKFAVSTNPIFVSSGHRLSLQTCILLVKRLRGDFKVPIPTRVVDLKSREEVRKKLEVGDHGG